MSRITDIRGREIIDSRGNPTVEADVILDSGVRGRAAVPSGASTGTREAVELRDDDPKRYGGKGVLKAVEHINTVLRQALLGADPRDQGAIDAKMIELDGTDNKARLGANAHPRVSLASAHAAADDAGEPLYRYLGAPDRRQREPVMPVPMMNIINGGAHANNSLDVQEFMILPVGAPSFREALRYGAEVFHALKKLLAERGPVDRGGRRGRLRAESATRTRRRSRIILEAIEKAGYRPGRDIYLGLDVASSRVLQGRPLRARVRERRFSAAEFTALPRRPRRQVTRSSPSRTA